MDATAKVEPAKAWFDGECFCLEGKSKTIRFPLNDVLDADLYRLGAMTIIRIRLPDGVLHVAVTRLLIGGSFVIVNVVRTRDLHARLVGRRI